MSTEIVLQIRSDPALAGYRDTIMIVQNNHFVYVCPAAGGPNHRQPYRFGAGPWDQRYGQIAPGSYSYVLVEHHRYGLAPLIAGGGQVVSRVPNPNHDGAKYLTEIFIHKGDSPGWRGSAGCPTVHPLFWRGFQYFFNPGDAGTFSVIDCPS